MSKLCKNRFSMMHPAILQVFPIAQAIEKLFYPIAEIVIHDIKANKIVAIYNPFSKRKVNDPSLLSQEKGALTLNDCTEPYEKINYDGRKIKSISSLIKNEKNNTVGVFCINLDVSKLELCRNAIDELLNYQALMPQPVPLFKDDWQERINQYIHTYLNQRHLRLETLNRIEKKQAIQHLNKIGAFTGKNAAQYIARLLKVSRATVYNYLA